MEHEIDPVGFGKMLLYANQLSERIRPQLSQQPQCG